MAHYNHYISGSAESVASAEHVYEEVEGEAEHQYEAVPPLSSRLPPSRLVTIKLEAGSLPSHGDLASLSCRQFNSLKSFKSHRPRNYI